MRNWNASRLARTCCAVRITWRKACPKRRPSARVAAEGSWRRSRIQTNAGSENSTKHAAGRRERPLLRSVADDALGDDGQREEDPDEAERNGDARDATAAAARCDVGQQWVVLGERQLPERDGDASGEEQRQDVPVGRDHLDERTGHGCDERERDQERLAPPELVGKRPGQRHGEQQEEDDDELRHRHVPVGPAQVVDDPRPEEADDEQEREDGVGEVPERPRQRCRVAQQVRAPRHCAEA